MIAGLLMGGLLFAQAAPNTFEVSGKVVDAVTQRSCAGMRVRIQQQEPPFRILSETKSGDDGGFQLRAPEGKFRLLVDRRGLPSQYFGSQALVGGFSSDLVVGKGKPLRDLRFLVYPPSSISGTVTDESGDPVASARVQLVESSRILGRRRSAHVAEVFTNDLGAYRFGGLRAGTYYLVVSGRPWYQTDLRSTVDSATFAPLFSPGVRNARAAVPFELSAGEDKTVNHLLSLVPARKLEVECATRLPGRVRIQIALVGPAGVDSYFGVQDGGGCDRTFEVPPGSYEVRLLNPEGSEALSARAAVEVTNSDVKVSLSPAAMASVDGAVAIKGPTNTRPTLIFLEDVKTGRTISRQTTSDGKFHFPAVMQSSYRVRVGASRGYHFESVALGEEPLKGNRFEVGVDSLTGLNVRMIAAGGRVRGRVFEGDVAKPGALVVLVSERELEPRAFATDSDGSYDIESVPAGQFKIFVAPRLDFLFEEPLEVAPLLANAQTVIVAKDATVELDLRVPLAVR